MVKNMTTQRTGHWWAGQRWDGCLARPSNLHRAAGALRSAGELPEAVGWQDYAVPTINQHGPSCCGQAWANWMEMMLRRGIGRDALKEGEQLDGYAIWKRGRELFNGGDLEGGLYLDQGFYAMLDLGIVPPESVLVEIDPDVLAITARLQLTPMVQGHIVAKGWYDPNPENGGLDESIPPRPGDGGHATCLMGFTPQDTQPFIVSQNSWGDDYGLHGYFTMSWNYWMRCYLGSGPCSADLPEGWKSWDGWRKYVTRDAQ